MAVVLWIVFIILILGFIALCFAIGVTKLIQWIVGISVLALFIVLLFTLGKIAAVIGGIIVLCICYCIVYTAIARRN